MSPFEIILTSGLLISCIGAILLAFRLPKCLGVMQENSSSTEHLGKTKSISHSKISGSRKSVRTGLILIVIGFVIQMVPYLMHLVFN